MGNGLITLIVIFVMLKIDIVTQLGRQSTPFFSAMTGKRSFLASGTRLWNNLDSATRGLTSLCKFQNQLYKKYIDRNSRVDHFTISRNV